MQGNKLRLWDVSFESIYPIGSCLVILAYNEDDARRMAGETIKHTSVFTIKEIIMDCPKIVVFQDGDY